MSDYNDYEWEQVKAAAKGVLFFVIMVILAVGLLLIF